MKLRVVLVFMVMFILFCLESFGQTPAKKERLNHDHVKPGMSQQQIDSLNQLTEQAKLEQKMALQALIQESVEKNKKNLVLKTDNCTVQNWGFEQANLNGWTTSGCVQLLNGGTDLYSGISNLSQGTYSLKLSNDMDYSCTNSQAARTYSVPTTGQTFITFHFKVNIFNFPHSSSDAARFNFNLYDQNGNQLSCPAYSSYYSMDEGPVGIPSLQESPQPATWYNGGVAGDLFFNSNVSYSNWHHVTVDLTQHAGTDVTMVFSNSWCMFGVDWIYTIIDVDCPINTSLPIPICLSEESVQLCAPTGMDASYSWEYEGISLANNNPCIDISEIGTYELTFSPTYLECDNQDYTINYELINTLTASFDVNEFCIGDQLVFTNQSQYVVSYDWSYAGQNSSDILPSFTYVPGELEVQLIIKTGSCTDTVVKNLIPHELPTLNIDFDKPCVGQSYKFLNESVNAEGGSISMEWIIGDNYVSSEWLPQYVAKDVDVISLIVSAMNQFGCVKSEAYLLTANPKPLAAFKLSDSILIENAALVKFINQSSNDVQEWHWSFGDNQFSSEESPSHEYIGSGANTATLIVMNEFGCIDTANAKLVINPALDCYVPNTFTPNNDQNNQVFKPVFYGSDISRDPYSFTIYNRWGEVVFYSDDMNEGWNGKLNHRNCNQGTYTWVLKYRRKSEDSMREINGHVNLVR